MSSVAGLHTDTAEKELHANQLSCIRLRALLLIRVEDLREILILFDLPMLVILVIVVNQLLFILFWISSRDLLY